MLRHTATGEIRLGRLLPGTREWRDLRPDGTPLPEPAPAAGWEPLLAPDDRVLDLHIPGGGGMTDPAILDSLERALRFYDSHFPGTPVKAFECDSWIFSPDLSDFLDRESNLVRFRDRVHLFPVETEDVAGLPFIFNTASSDPADWPETTSLQRALKKHLAAGGKFRLSGMILSRTELDRFRTNPM